MTLNDETAAGVNGATASKSTRAARGWATRRANQALKLASTPLCTCGCGKPLEKASKPEKQKLFLQGHDAILKSLFVEILKGRASAAEIPAVAKQAAPRIGFVRHNPTFARLLGL